MLITDGVMPGNEGRGYVLRRIIRRAVRHLNELGLERPSIHELVPTVFEALGSEYPQNMANADLAIKLLKLEEEKFRQTLKTGLELLNKEIKKLKSGKELSGEIAFKLYDTYGFPLDLTEIIAQEHGLSLNTDEFHKAMAKQKASSRSASKFATTEDNTEAFYKIKESTGDSKFNGYSNLFGESTLIASIPFGDHQALVFAETPFYPEGGGQVGDTGLIYNTNNELVAEVLDTQKLTKRLIYTQSK
jgi:alanyl-tRNA synthetase